MPKRKTAPNSPSRSSPGSSSRISSSSAPSCPCSLATVGYEAELWRMADAFEEQHARLVVEQAEGADPDEYLVLPEDGARGEKLMSLSIGHGRRICGLSKKIFLRIYSKIRVIARLND